MTDRKQITEQHVVLDGAVLIDVDLIRCIVSYRGGTVPLMRNVNLVDARVTMEAQASNTVTLLRGMLKDPGMRDLALRILGESIAPTAGTRTDHREVPRPSP